MAASTAIMPENGSANFLVSCVEVNRPDQGFRVALMVKFDVTERANWFNSSRRSVVTHNIFFDGKLCLEPAV